MVPTSPKVLVIDDNTEILAILEIVLTRHGYKVVLKSNASEYKTAIREVQPCLLLLDIKMHGADGSLICKELKQDPEFAQLPVVMLSSFGKMKEECLAFGADGFLEKPFDLNELLKVAESFCKPSKDLATI